MHVWSSSKATHSLAAGLGEVAGDSAQAQVWLLDGDVGRALEIAAGARPEQVVIYVGALDDWSRLGKDFDDAVPASVSTEELAARVRSRQHDRQTEPRSRLLRMLAHDLNNPLTAIRLLSEMLVYEVTGDETRQDLQDILEASDLAAALVESVSAYAKLGLADRNRPQTVDLGAILAETTRRPCLTKSVEYDAPRMPITLRGDSNAIKQAVLDLLLNARRLSEGKHPVQVTLEVKADSAQVAARTRLVEAYAGLDSLRHPHGSTPLRDARTPVSPTGLAHAEQLANSMGGQLDIVVADRIVTFALELPLSR